MKRIICSGFLLVLVGYWLFPGLTHAAIPAAERQALIALYNSTNGDSWSENSGWKHTFVVREQHAAWGAALAEEAGSSEEVVDLILRHQDPLPMTEGRNDASLALLQWADGQN